MHVWACVQADIVPYYVNTEESRLQDPRDADDAVRKLDGFRGWVRFLCY
jgi:hypothetical protein